MNKCLICKDRTPNPIFCEDCELQEQLKADREEAAAGCLFLAGGVIVGVIWLLRYLYLVLKPLIEGG